MHLDLLAVILGCDECVENFPNILAFKDEQKQTI